VGLILGLTIGLLLIVDYRQRTAIVHQMEKRGLTIASHLAAVSTNALVTYDFVRIEQLVEKVSQEQDVLYTIMLDRQGQVAAYSGRDDQQGMMLSDPVSARAAQVQKPLIQHVPRQQNIDEHYDIAVPVFVHGSREKWGTVRVGLSLHDMWADMAKTRFYVLFLGVIGILVGTGAAALLARRITAPIRALTEGTMAVARGEALPAIEVHAHDELAVLAAHFNHMTRELRKHQTALRQKIDEISILANYNKNILASMTSGLFTLDLHGRFETVNPMAERLTGIRAENACGRDYHHVLAENATLCQVLTASYRHESSLTVPRLDFVRADGERVPLALRTAMLRDRDGKAVGLLAIFEDLSPIQTLEKQLQRADRLATLGQMAAGIAHEIKNPLASVRLFAQLVSRKHHDASFVEKFDRVVPRELDRVNGIVEELLALARPAKLHCRPISIIELLQRIIEPHTERFQARHIVCKTEFATVVPLVNADAEQLTRALTNILLNAIEAMPAGGELSIACRPAPKALFDVVTSTYHARAAAQDTESLGLEPYTTDAEIVFRDTGEGIPADQLDLLFTPFYTTKPQGTGLGLALTHKIVEEHHGSIGIVSDVGGGTTVTVTLPASSPPPLPRAHIS
jgi:two-component system sensor histidine kinase AtoS